MSTETKTEQKTEQKSDNDWSKREMGALWRREGKTQNYLSGYVKIGEFGTEKEVRVIVFTNKGKAKNPKAPDFVIYESQELNAQGASPALAAQAPAQEEHDPEVPSGL